MKNSRASGGATHHALARILVLGAAYGSLLASKMLFGGHKIHHVCLPAEADLINAEGFKVTLPVRGRARAGAARSRKNCRARSPPAAPPASIRPTTISSALAMQEPQYRSPGVRELLDAVGDVQGAVHVDHEHAAAAYMRAHPGLDYEALEAGLYRPDGVGQFRSRPIDVVQPGSAGHPPAGRQGERAAGHAADQLQSRQVRGRQGHRRSYATSRTRSTPCGSIRATAPRSSCR